MRRGPFSAWRTVLGQRIAPPRFLFFLAVLLVTALAWRLVHASPPGDALVVGYDLASLVFMGSLAPLLGDHGAAAIRRHAAQNDANRASVLLITAATTLAILMAITTQLPAARTGNIAAIAMLIATLTLSWIFTNLVFMLHYAHMYYAPAGDGADRKGFAFPGTDKPGYWDFLYFSFTAGMSFAASDVNVTRSAVRRVVVAHSLLSFVFNIGILAFTINVLAGAAG